MTAYKEYMNLNEILQKHGLSEKEAQIYLNCLELGPSPVQKIANKAGVARSTTYEVLDDLIKKGIVFTYLKKKVKYFSAIEPVEFVEQSKEKFEILNQALPLFQALFNKAGETPSVRLYEGKEGIKIIFNEILKEAKSLIAFGSSEDVLNELGDVHSHFLEERLKRKIAVKLILTDTESARERKNTGQEQLREVRLLPPEYSYHGLIYIWNNKIAMFSLTGKLLGMVIESKQLFQMQKTIFEFTWKSLSL